MNLRPRIAIDIGTARTKAMNGQTGIICPSKVLRDLQQDRTLAVGNETIDVTASAGQELISPVRDGVMNHYGAGQSLVRHIMNELLPWWTLMRPTVVLSKSQLARPAQLQQVRQATRLAGGGSVFAADVTALAALGAGVEPDNATATLVVDCGAGTTEAAVITRATPVVQSAKAVGGEDLELALIDYMQDQFGFELSHDRAQSLLVDIGSALEVSSAESVSLEEGGETEVTTNDIARAIDSELKKITQLVQGVMRDSSAALLSDVATRGIILTGGVAQLRNFDTRLSRRLGVPVTVIDKPETAVVRGGRQAHNFVDTYRESTTRRNAFAKQNNV